MEPNENQWDLWSCGPWPRRVFEQWLREAFPQRVRVDDFLTEDPEIVVGNIPKNRVKLWSKYLIKNNISFQLTTQRSTISNPPEFAAISVEVALAQRGPARVTP